MGVHEEKVKGAYIYGQNDNGLIKRPIRDLNSLVEKKGTWRPFVLGVDVAIYLLGAERKKGRQGTKSP